MKALLQTIRGGFAWAAWFAGAPFISTYAAYFARDRDSTCAVVNRHFARFLRTCRVTVVQDGPLPQKGEGAVICYNESSFVDVAAFAVLMWDFVDRVAAADLYAYLPFVRRLANKAQIELVPRGNRAGTDHLLDSLIAKVQGGDRLTWGGEGHLVGIDGVGHFKRGACLIAIRAQVPVIPLTYYGGHRAMPLGSIRARPGKVHVRFGEPISTEGLTEEDARDLADRVQAQVAQTYEELREEYGHS